MAHLIQIGGQQGAADSGFNGVRVSSEKEMQEAGRTVACLYDTHVFSHGEPRAPFSPMEVRLNSTMTLSANRPSRLYTATRSWVPTLQLYWMPVLSTVQAPAQERRHKGLALGTEGSRGSLERFRHHQGTWGGGPESSEGHHSPARIGTK